MELLIGAAIGAIVSIATTLLTAEDPQSTTTLGPRLANLQAADSKYGSIIPALYGTCRVSGNLIWSDDIEEVQVVEESETPGKGGGGGATQTNVTFLYFCSFRFAFCLIPVDPQGMLQLFFNGELVYNRTAPAPGEPTNQIFWKHGGQSPLPRFYDGSQTQVPDVIEEGILTPELAPAYRGIASVFVERLPLIDYGNGLPSVAGTISGLVAPAFPKIVFTGGTPPAPESNLFAYDPVRNLFAVTSFNTSEATVDVYDITAGMVVSSFTTRPEDGDITDIAFDPATGLLYTGHDTAAFVAQISEYEPLNGMYIRTSGDISLGGANTVPRPRCTGFTTRGGLGQTFMIVGCGAIFRWVLLNLGIDGDGAFERIDDFSLAAQAPICCFTDRDGFVWFLVDAPAGGTEPTLLRIEPVLGAEMGSFIMNFIQVPVPGVTDPEGMQYDPGLNVILVCGQDPDDPGGRKIVKFDIDSLTVLPDVFTDTIAGFDFLDDNVAQILGFGGQAENMTGGGVFLAIDTSFDTRLLNLSTMTLDANGTSMGDLDDDFNDMGETGMFPLIYQFRQNAVIGAVAAPENSTMWRIMFLGRMDGAGVTLDTIIRAISFLCGVGVGFGAQPDLVSAAPLAAVTVRGLLIDKRQRVAEVFSLLQKVYDFEVVESDFVLLYRLKPLAVLEALEFSDLGADEESPNEEPFDYINANDVELPNTVNVGFYNLDADYQEGQAPAFRNSVPIPTAGTVQSVDLSLPLVLTQAEADAIAYKILYTVFNEKAKVKFQLDISHIFLDPTDPVSLPIGADIVKCRILLMDVGANGVLQFESKIQQDQSFTAPIMDNEPGGIGGQIMVDVGNSELFLIDSIGFRDADLLGANSQSILYVGLAGRADGYRGAAAYKTFGSAGITQIDANTYSVAYGFGLDIPEEFDITIHNTWDRVNTLTAAWSLGADQIVSHTEDEVLEGAGALLWGNEIIQYVNRTINMDGTITFDTLLRARRGSGMFGEEHRAGERVIFLHPRIHAVPVSTAERNVTVPYRHVPFGRSLDQSVAVPHNHQANSLKPLPPVHIQMREDFPATGDLFITGIRQTRVGGGLDLSDGVDQVPDPDGPSRFRIYILAAPDDLNEEAIRVITEGNIDLPVDPNAVGYDFSYTYLAADRSDDGTEGAVHARFFQISDVVGEGFPCDASSSDPRVAA